MSCQIFVHETEQFGLQPSTIYKRMAVTFVNSLPNLQSKTSLRMMPRASKPGHLAIWRFLIAQLQQIPKIWASIMHYQAGRLFLPVQSRSFTSISLLWWASPHSRLTYRLQQEISPKHKAPTVCLLFDRPVKLNINGNKLFINCLQTVNKWFHQVSNTSIVLILQKSAFDPNLHQDGLRYRLRLQRRT